MALNMEKITITKEKEGTRIDKFLAEEFFLYSRGEIVRKIKEGNVSLKGKSVKPSYVLTEDDVLALENFSREKEPDQLFANAKIPLRVISENQNVIFIDKQAGIQVHPSHNEKEKTLTNALIFKFPELKEVHDDSEGAVFRPGIVHRLDKDTSGVMVVARNQKSLEALKNLFKERKIEKKYLAVVEGIFNEKEGLIEKPIARATSYSKQVVARKNTKTTIREAVTSYRVLAERNGYSLVEASPKTGRMHQIRVHFASMGHPVVGDLIYGSKKEAENTPQRHLLHAKSIKFELFKRQYEVKAPLTEEFKAFFPEFEDEIRK